MVYRGQKNCKYKHDKDYLYNKLEVNDNSQSNRTGTDINYQESQMDLMKKEN